MFRNDQRRKAQSRPWEVGCGASPAPTSLPAFGDQKPEISGKAAGFPHVEANVLLYGACKFPKIAGQALCSNRERKTDDPENYSAAALDLAWNQPTRTVVDMSGFRMLRWPRRVARSISLNASGLPGE